MFPLSVYPNGVFIHHIFFIIASVDGHLGWFPSLAVANSVKLNIDMPSISMSCLESFRFMPGHGDGVARSCDSSILSF